MRCTGTGINRGRVEGVMGTDMSMTTTTASTEVAVAVTVVVTMTAAEVAMVVEAAVGVLLLIVLSVSPHVWHGHSSPTSAPSSSKVSSPALIRSCSNASA
jgi:hypothetical protein